MSLTPVTHAQVAERVEQLAREVFELDAVVPPGRGHLIEDLGATSVMRLEFLVALERAFDVQLDAQELEKSQTISEVASAICARLGASS